MTFRSREDHLAASEELSPYSQPGSCFFSQPTEIQNWCQSTVPTEGLYPLSYPLTPPDTASDCAPSDCADMNQPWTKDWSPAESWQTASAPEYSTGMHHDTRSEWRGPSFQDVQQYDSAWPSLSQGPVDTGLSPVPSHESLNSHVLPPVSETDIASVGLDLSFINDPFPDAAGYLTYPESTTAAQSFPPTMVSSPEVLVAPQGEFFHSGPVSFQQTTYGSQQPMYYFQAGPPAPRRAISDPSFVQARPIMPRMEGPAPDVNGHSRNAPHVGLRQVSDAGHAEIATRVSSGPGLPANIGALGPAHVVSAGHLASPAFQAPAIGLPTPRPDSAPARHVAVQPHYQETPHQDCNGIVGYDSQQVMPAASASYPQGLAPVPAHQISNGSRQVRPTDPSFSTQGPSSGMDNANEDGKHRTHYHYKQPPQPDGLYHCPYEAEGCGHKPHKLKCNYDKYIDSHVKPFRCKQERCTNQAFSSTACLLRHEREAHGMHGHGDRPNLCLFAGCDRSQPGNGFPRRYNLFDHMKRVHDYDDKSSFDRGPLDGPRRKNAGRKRKASDSPAVEPVSQRMKMEHAPTPVSQPSPSMYAPHVASAYPDVQTQPGAHPHWSQQRTYCG